MFWGLSRSKVKGQRSKVKGKYEGLKRTEEVRRRKFQSQGEPVVHRLVASAVSALVALLVLAVSASIQAGPSWISEDGYDWWSDCSDIPDPLEFLPIYLGSEVPG